MKTFIQDNQEKLVVVGVVMGMFVMAISTTIGIRGGEMAPLSAILSAVIK